jgi:thioredoxin reductase/Fe-S-cluster-containing hydrogenase component 2
MGTTKMEFIREIDLLVIGAGPAGLGAAIEARRLGSQVLVVDDNHSPGGQLFKQIHKFFGSVEHGAGARGLTIGQKLLAEAELLGVEICLSTRALGFLEDSTMVLIENDSRLYSCKVGSIVLATGGVEKAISFPGCTLPGVMTAGAAQTLCNVERVLPGKKIIMVGSGNVGLIVAYQLLQAGADIIAIIEARSRVSGYSVHATKIKRAGVPIYTGYTIKEVQGLESVESVDIIAVDDNWNPVENTEISFSVDTVCLSVGLKPHAQLARMCGCKIVYDSDLGGFYPWHDGDMQSSKKGIFVAGDLVGIEEASIALDEGRLAGVGAAFALGYLNKEKADHLKEQYRKRLVQLRKKSEVEEKSIYKDLTDLPGYPSEKRIKEKTVAIIECGQEIPCNPCVEICPTQAIVMGTEITDLPRLLEDKCTGCGLCLSCCPGLAIFLLNYNYSEEKAVLSIPYEYFPYPEVGEILPGIDRDGKTVTHVEVVKVDIKKVYDRTAIISVSLDKEFIHLVRSIKPEGC